MACKDTLTCVSLSILCAWFIHVDTNISSYTNIYLSSSYYSYLAYFQLFANPNNDLYVFSYISAFMQWESSLRQESASYDLAHRDFHLCLHDSELRMAFTLLNGFLKKFKNTDTLWHMKMQVSVSINKMLLEQPYSLVYILSMAVFRPGE